jgi:acetylornithine deacetylase/succinyl-diaminopimelate desuccinylase-like protein
MTFSIKRLTEPITHQRTVIALAQILLLITPVICNGQQQQNPPQQQPTPQQQNVQPSRIRISTPEEIAREFETVPCRQEDRLAAVRTLFERMGASASDITVERLRGRDVENLIVRKPGASEETIVVGAHYDRASEGCGAVDNWTGVVAMAHLYRTLKDVPLRKTLLFVAFGKEERGLIGSRAMVDAIPRDQLSRYCSMVNIDSLGLAAPQVADNISTAGLRELAETLAGRMRIPFAHGYLDGTSDSASFLRRQIPALTIHGLTSDFRSIIHTPNDQTARVNAQSVYLGYRLALAMVAHLVEGDCGRYRQVNN